MKVTDKPANPHREHRTRVKQKFLRSGLDSFAPHEVLEMILFYAVPQKDTNPLAHRLLDRFGNLFGVFSARQEELCAVEGVSDHVATLLRLWLPATSYAMAEKRQEETPVFGSVGTIGDYFVSRYIGHSCETVYLLLLDNSYSYLDCVKVHEGSVNSVGITPRKLIELALYRHASMAVLAHNHPGGIAVPSSEDLQTTSNLAHAFSAVGIPLVEHILVAGETYSPLIYRSQRVLAGQTMDPGTFYADLRLFEPEKKR